MSFGGGGFGFGQNNNTTSSFGGFGNNNNNTTSSFGSGTTMFGGQQASNSGLFGNTGNNTNAFGSTTGAFGSTGNSAFGAKPAFGATTSAGGGLFGSTTATAGSSGFGGGGFGTNTASTSSPFGGGGTTSMFGGANKPAFGASTAGTGLFGSSNTANATTTNTGFGSTSTPFGATSNPGIGTNVGDPPGTAAVAYNPFIEKENNNTNQQNSFQNITFMDAYKKWSPEELRLADYNQGRRYGNSTGTGAFGVSSGFGGFGSNTANNNATGGGLFGNNNSTNTTAGAFGSNNTTTSAFGANNSTNNLFNKPAGGGLFGSTAAQPAQSGSLFGNSGTGGFGTTNNTGSAFGSTAANNTGSLFGNANQNKPAGGFGSFGSTQPSGFGNAGAASGFGTTTTTANTGGGLFGSTTNNATPAAGGGLFGAANQNTTPNAFGASTAGGFGTQNQSGGLFGPKPATGGLFGTANNAGTNTATGGGLFGNNTAGTGFGQTNPTQQAGGMFGAKPAAATGAGGGLFGASQPAAAGGGLFGNMQAGQAQQQPQANSLFGSAQSQQKPSLFGATTAAPAGGSLFGGQAAAQQSGGGLFGQSTAAAQPQANALGGSMFGNSMLGGGLGASQQGLTTSIADAGAYGAPSLFQNLAAAEVHNPGPLATPLSGNKAKTSRRSSILPLYKMNPSSASTFATPQKRGYGFSYSTFGTPNSASSTASTPGGLNQSLLMGSVGRGLGKSMSSSNLRRTYNAEDSILLPGAFSASSGPRYYGSTGGSKKLVINRDMRSDLFSTPSKVKDKSGPSGSEVSSDGFASGSVRKLTKRVSFDTAIAKENASAGGDSDLGYLRPQSRPTNGGNATSSAAPPASNGSSGSPAFTTQSQAEPAREPEMDQITGKELAIVHEEDSSPFPRCIPENYKVNSKELGEYWMSPSKEEIERMNRVQRQQVFNFTVGRTNVGQVRFRVPVDLTKINLDSIMDGIVTLVIRSATVYPKAETKPPVGQGLNVAAEILLLHTCPRSGPDVSSLKMKKHVQRLKAIPNTTFVSYDERTAAWLFRVEHFTTYGLDDDDDETDGETTGVSTADERETSAAAGEFDDDDDTFDFRRRKRVAVPGAFDSGYDLYDDEDEQDVTPRQSFLSKRSAVKGSLAILPAETAVDDENMELGEDSLLDNEVEATYSLQQHPTAELDNNSLEENDEDQLYPEFAPVVPETPAGVLRARFRAIKESNAPLDIQVADGDNWMEMLRKTVSPQKRDRAALRAVVNELEDATESLSKSTYNSGRKSTLGASIAEHGRLAPPDNRGFATSIDLMNSLFENSKAPPAQASKPITPAKGFVKWPYKRQDKTNDEDGDNMNSTERAFHEAVRPAWSADGACIVTDQHGAVSDAAEPPLKRVRVFDSEGLNLTDNLLEGIQDHKEAVDIELVDGVPSVSTRRVPACRAFAGFCEQANQRQASTSRPISKQLGSYEQSVWELASVLFDPVDDAGSDTTETARLRRDNLSRFWAQLVQDASGKSVEKAQSLGEKALAYLTGRRVPEACKALVDEKDYKLATLVSLIGTSDSFKKDMREQIDDWQQGDVLAEIGVPLRSVYSLLAGNVAVCEGKKGSGVENRTESVVLSETFGLDWKQSFGLRLWYGIAAGEGIESAVAKYVEDLEQGRVPAPRPWYANKRDVPVAWADPQREQREDLLFGLLKVAAGISRLEDVLEPESAQLSPFHFRLCWQLSQALDATNGIAKSAKLSAEKSDTLTSIYAAEVVYHGNNDVAGRGHNDAWVHAIWVLLHLSNPASRTQAVQDVLGRHADTLFNTAAAQTRETSLYERLVENLKIPATWVWQAAALYWRSQQTQPALEAECLLRASAYTDAHRIFVKDLAPQAIVERNYNDIAEMLSKLQPHRHQIPDWQLGGDVYSRFLDLVALQRGGTIGAHDTNSAAVNAPRTRGRQQQAKSDAEQAAAQLTSVVEALVSSLPAMYDNASDAGPTEVAAITEMADAVAKEMMALANKGRMDLTKISRLPLTEDRRLRYSTSLAYAYYREVTATH